MCIFQKLFDFCCKKKCSFYINNICYRIFKKKNEKEKINNIKFAYYTNM